MDRSELPIDAAKEALRQQTLDEFEILDTLPEQDFDDLVALASHICGTPISAVSLVDRDRQWFKASVGLDATETPRDISFCQHTIWEQDLFVVSDASKDARFADGPLVVNDPKIRFYAGAPLIASNGQAIGAFCVKDVKPRELSETQLEALRRLARQAMGQFELRKSYRLLKKQMLDLNIAQSANEAKTHFLSRVSHELRTPLNAILGFAQLLEMYNPNAMQGECVEHILSAGKHLLGLIDEVLDLSRIESGNISVTTKPVSLLETAQEAAGLVRHLAQERGIEVKIDVSLQSGMTVLADRQRLLQVFINLLSNGIKYNVSGGTVEVFAPSCEAGQVRIGVRDNGLGIEDEMKERVFVPFDRLGVGDRLTVEGTGLGLTLSKALVEAMEGRISFESQLGVGTTFWLEMPRANVRAEQDMEVLDAA